jgi:hypothetical protein
VLSGLLSMMLLVVVGTAAASALLPEGAAAQPGVPYLTLNLGYSTAFAAVGGWIAARLAPRRATLHAAALASLVAVLAVASTLAAPPQPGQPPWYGWVVALLGVGGALAGGAMAAPRTSSRAGAPLGAGAS